MSKLTVSRIVAALRKVPEKRLAIMDLAPELVDEQGKVNVARCLDRQPEINLALIEVQSYVSATRSAAFALSHVSGVNVEHPGDGLEAGTDDELEVDR